MLRAVGGIFGLPWSGAAETVLFAVVLPLLLVLAPGFLRRRPAQVGLSLLLCGRPFVGGGAGAGPLPAGLRLARGDGAGGVGAELRDDLCAGLLGRAARAAARAAGLPHRVDEPPPQARREREWLGLEIRGAVPIPKGPG